MEIKTVHKKRCVPNMNLAKKKKDERNERKS